MTRKERMIGKVMGELRSDKYNAESDTYWWLRDGLKKLTANEIVTLHTLLCQQNFERSVVSHGEKKRTHKRVW